MKFTQKLCKLCMVCAMCLTILPVQEQVLHAETKSNGKTYYIDSNSTSENGNGETPQTAFKYLEQANEKVFQPGDRILLKAGSVFKGTLYPKGSGSAGMPIIIDMYGDGAKPKINANGATFMPQKKDWQGPFVGEDGKQIGAAVYLYNQEYIEINNLDVQNPGSDQNADCSGIRVEGYDYGTLHHIYIRNCNIHDVRGYNGQDDIYPVVPTKEDGSPLDGYIEGNQQNPNTSNTFWGARTTHRTGGINFVTYTARKKEAKNKFNVLVQELDDSKKVTTFDDIRIEHNTIENCQANGITTTNVKGTLDDTSFRHTNVIIRNNNIHNVTRAGIIPLYTSGVLVEFNKVDTFQSTTEGYGCGIWCDRADNMIFQYNEVCNGQNGNDGMAFNIDDMTRDGLVQYNYTHDNYGGGYMLHVRQKSYNRNNTIRYNLSINDSGAFLDHNAQVVAVGETDITKLEQAKVYNNTFISDKECHAVYKGDDVTYTNNIWYFTNPAMIHKNNSFAPGEHSTFKNNAYIGVPAPIDSDAHTDDPLFTGGTALFHLDQEHAYAAASLKTSSPYIQAGLLIEQDGEKDILGRDLKKNRNLGAFGGNGHKTTLAPITIKADDSKLKRYTYDGEQTETVQETVSEAQTKWVNTTFQNEPVIYTKKTGNYLTLSFHGTGGVLKLKRGAGAGKIIIEAVLAKDPTHIIKKVQVNTYHDTADTIILNDLVGLSEDNSEYVLRLYNAEEGKASNFMSFTSQVADETSSVCPNDELTAIILEEPQPLLIPYGEQQTSIALHAHVLKDTCNPIGHVIPITYQVNSPAIVNDNIVTFPRAGDYRITATASENGRRVTAVKNVHVAKGDTPQVNVMPVFTIGIQNLIMQCEAINLHDYMVQGQAHFKETLASAKKTASDTKVTQAMIDAVTQELTNARDALRPLKVNAEDASVKKKGNWITISDATLDHGTALKSGVQNERMSYTFDGNEIRVYGRRAVGTGITKFSIVKEENGKETILDTKEVDCYSTAKQDQSELYGWHGAKNGTYRLDIVNTGTKNAAATDINTIIDYFKLTQQTSSNANLSSITGVALHETFNKDTLMYTADVSNDVTHINLQAISEHDAAVVKIMGPEMLAIGNNTFTITVTAEDQTTTKVYTVIVKRADALSSNNYLQSITGIQLQEPFDKNTVQYSAVVQYETTSVQIQAKAEDADAKIKIQGADNLQVGENIATIQVTAQNQQVRTYTITITRKAKQPSSNAYISSLSGIDIQPAFDKKVTEYTAEVPYETTVLHLLVQCEDAVASVAIQGEKDLKVGINTITITVTAEDGTHKRYTIYVTRKPQVQANVDTFINMIEALPETISKQQTADIVQIVRMYNMFTEQDKQLISKSSMAKLENVKQQMAKLNHTADSVTIRGLPWNVAVASTALPANKLESMYDLHHIVEAYDITLYDIMNNEKYIPKKELNVSIRLKANDKIGTWNLYHIDHGTVKKVPATVKDNVLTFYAKQFSPYVITKGAASGNVENTNVETVDTADVTQTQLWVLLGTVAIIAFGLCFMKKRNRSDKSRKR